LAPANTHKVGERLVLESLLFGTCDKISYANKFSCCWCVSARAGARGRGCERASNNGGGTPGLSKLYPSRKTRSQRERERERERWCTSTTHIHNNAARVLRCYYQSYLSVLLLHDGLMRRRRAANFHPTMGSIYSLQYCGGG